MYTIDDVKNAWAKFINYTMTAEQHEFITLAMYQYKLGPLYEDLLVNWDEQHAELFMKGVNFAFRNLGVN